MGTLVSDTNKDKKNQNKGNLDQPQNVENKDLKKLQKKVDKEFSKLRYEMEKLRQAFDAVDSAKSYDDINQRLKNLEQTSRKLRKGGLMFKGAKYHSKLLNKIHKIGIK